MFNQTKPAACFFSGFSRTDPRLPGRGETDALPPREGGVGRPIKKRQRFPRKAAGLFRESAGTFSEKCLRRMQAAAGRRPHRGRGGGGRRQGFSPFPRLGFSCCKGTEAGGVMRIGEIMRFPHGNLLQILYLCN